MHRLNLKFPYIGQHSPLIDYSLLILGSLVLVAVFYQFKLSTANIDSWEARVERLEKQQQRNQPARRPSRHRKREGGQDIRQEIRQEVEQASKVMTQINLPWESFFNAIEFASDKDVALLSLQPSVTNRTLSISGEARNMSSLLDFVEALEREAVFDNTHLLNYKIKLDSPQRPVIFLITTLWVQQP